MHCFARSSDESLVRYHVGVMKKLLAVFCFAWQMQAAINSVTVSGVTSTQAILSYIAPDSGACTVEVSESATYSPLVNDVDPAKFASANMDTRPGTLRTGVERTFVIGKRAAEVGLDTIRYSRALQTATRHYYRITCPSTGDQATGQFDTVNIPFGNGYAEAQATDPQQAGKYALPTLSSSDRTQQVIDPQTGLLLKRLVMPRDIYIDLYGMPLSTSRSNSWSNPGNVTGFDGNAATVSGNTGALFLGLAVGQPYGAIASWATAYGQVNIALGYFQAHIYAAVNPNGTAPTNPEDRKVIACLTIDGVNCYEGSAKYEATLGTSYQDQAFGSTSTIDLWQKSPGAQVPNWTQQGPRQGLSMCDGSPVVQYASGEPYGIHWVPGSTININNQNYTIASVQHTGQITLTTNCPSMLAGAAAFDPGSRTLRTPVDTFSNSDNNRTIVIYGAGGGGSNLITVIDFVADARTIVTHDFPAVQGVNTTFGYPAYHYATNFGVLLWKKTTSADTIAVDYASVNYEYDYYFRFLVGGGFELCSSQTLIGPNGRPGYNCVMPDSAVMYWIDAESGESHLFSSANTIPNVRCDVINQFFDAQDPDKYICGGTGVLYTTKYYGNHSEPTSLNGSGSLLIFQNLNNCNTAAPNVPPYTNQQPCLVSKITTPGTDIGSLTEAFTANPAYAPQFNKSLFTNLLVKAVDPGGNILIQVWRGGGNSVGWNLVFNPNATSNAEGGSSTGPSGNFGCVGNGAPGCVIAAMPAWARPGCRWCTIKDSGPAVTGWFSVATYGWINYGPGTGPYYVPVIDGTADGNINYVDGSSSLTDCPPNLFGASGHNCTVLTVASEPLSPNHGGGETGLPGELGPAQPGDRFQFEVQLPANNTEQAMLINKVPGVQPGTWIYTLWRDVNHAHGHFYYSTGPNPNLYTVCAANQIPSYQGAGNTWLWNFVDDPHGMNLDGTTIPPDPSSVNDHFFWSNGTWGATATSDAENRCGSGENCYSMRLPDGRPFSHVISDLPLAGVGTKNVTFGQGSADLSNMQSHPTGGGTMASPELAKFMFDGRPYRGGYSSGSGGGTGSNPATLVSGQLYKFPATSMPNIDLPFRKIYPTSAFTGNLPLLDISSPATGNVLGTGPSDSYKYCVAAATNECRTGSSAGDVYVNAPYVRYPFCVQAQQAYNFPDEYDICIGGSPVVHDGIMQIAMDRVDNEGRFQRLLTKFNRARVLSPFYTPYVLPNGKWMIMESHLPGDASINKSFLLAKIPPPATQDSVNRLTFVPITVTLPPVTGATNAFVRFGYAENGDPASLFCTSRKESCVVGQGDGVDPANPFHLETVEAGSWIGTSCASGCTLTVPAIPGRILYYQYVYRNDTGTVYTSPLTAQAVP